MSLKPRYFTGAKAGVPFSYINLSERSPGTYYVLSTFLSILLEFIH